MKTESRSPKRQRLHFAISVIVTGTFLYFALRGDGGGQVLTILQNVDLRGVAFYVMLSMFGLVVRAWRYRLLLTSALGQLGCPSIPRLLIVTAIRNAFVDLLPARLGEVVYVYVLNRYGVRAATGASTFGFCIALDIIILFMLVLVFLLFGMVLAGTGESSIAQLLGENALLTAIVVAALILLLSGLIFLIPKILRACCRLLNRISRAVSHRPVLRRAVLWVEENTENIATDLDKIEHGGKLPQLALLTILLRLTKYGSLYVLLLAVVGQWGLTFNDFNFGLTTVAFIIAEASSSLPISGIMGFGAYETSWGLVFHLAEVNLPHAAKVALVVHLITQIKGYSVGMLAMAFFLFFQARRSRTPVPADKKAKSFQN